MRRFTLERIPRARAPRAGTLLALALALALLPGALAAQAPAGTVSGTVHAEDGAPIANVHVTIAGTGLGALTDARGGFHIANVPPGTAELRAEHLGWSDARVRLDVPAGGAARASLVLRVAAVALADVVVTATREAVRRIEIPATIESVGAAEIARVRPTHPSELLNRMAGVWVNTTGGEGHSAAIRQPRTTSPVYLYLEDGVPTRSTGFFNHNALYEVNVPQAQRVEVQKGPSSALYGSDAIGGMINVLTRAPDTTRPLELSLEGGAHGFARLLAAASTAHGAHGLRAELNLTRSDGWRDASAYERQSATVRWDVEPGAGTTVRTQLTASHIDQQTAGAAALSEADYRSDPTRNYTPISFRRVSAVRAATTVDHVREATLFSATAFLRWNRMEMLPNWTLAFDPHVSRTGHASAGLMLKVRRELAPARARVIAGLDVDYSPGMHREWQIDAARANGSFTTYTRGERSYDYDVRFRELAPYLQLEAEPLARFRVVAGLRYDHIGYDYETHLPALQTGALRRPASTTLSYDHLSPKLGATLELGRALNLYAAHAHAFRAPSEGQLFRQGRAESTLDLQPVKADNLEVGARGRIGTLEYGATAYRMIKTDDVLTWTAPDGTRETVNAGRTLHRGLELSAALTPVAGVRLEGGWTFARHRYERWQLRTGEAYDGRQMEEAPSHMGSLAATLSPARLRGGTLGAELHVIGPMWLDAANTQRYAGHELVALRATLPLGERLRLSARVRNLLDVRYAESAQYTEARGRELAPGAPRSLFIGLEYR